MYVACSLEEGFKWTSTEICAFQFTERTYEQRRFYRWPVIPKCHVLFGWVQVEYGRLRLFGSLVIQLAIPKQTLFKNLVSSIIDAFLFRKKIFCRNFMRLNFKKCTLFNYLLPRQIILRCFLNFYLIYLKIKEKNDKKLLHQSHLAMLKNLLIDNLLGLYFVDKNRVKGFSKKHCTRT